MRYTIIASLTLLGATVSALPHVAHQHQIRDYTKTWKEGNNVYVEDVKVVTATWGSSPSPAAEEKIARPVHHVESSSSVAPVVASPAPVVTPAATSPSPAAQADTGSGTGTGPVPGPSNVDTAGSATWSTSPNSMGKSIIGTANYWRTKWNPSLGPFQWDETLASNARSTAVDAIFSTTNSDGTTTLHNEGGANQMNHNLNPGSMGQCINEGDAVTMNGDLTPFENAWLGWICERANGNVPCDQIGEYKQGYAIDTKTGRPETGHADIIGGQYTKMGCYYQDGTEHPSFTGMWTCDFA